MQITINKQLKHQQQQQQSRPRVSFNFVNYIQTNKLQSFFVALLISAVSFYSQPEYIRNPKVFARNRLTNNNNNDK
jgi:hypothetical protein